MSLTLAILQESAPGEARVALDPGNARQLSQKYGLTIVLQQNAGLKAGFADSEYPDVTLAKDTAAALKQADIVATVRPPALEVARQLPEGSLLICHLNAHENQALIDVLCARRITCLAFEWVPRTTRAQSVDTLSSQAAIAGYKGALLAATHSPRIFPMLTTAAGTIRPAKVLVIGAGVAGLQAIATARRLGAQVEAYDIRPSAREQVESLGARMIDTGVSAEGEGGYARALSDEEKAQQAQVLAEHLKQADAVITTAAIPGKPAPQIITDAMIADMKQSAVIVDLAAESGGNCAGTQAGKTVQRHGVTLIGVENLISSGAVHASQMFARNLANLLGMMLTAERGAPSLEDEIVQSCMVTHAGEVTHEQVRHILQQDTENA